MSTSSATRLYLVPTPIGNLGDITLRALEVLKSVDIILAEDTRTSSKLLKHYGVTTPVMAYHMHNEHKITSRLVERMSGGEVFALITDAGTPGISDPGFMILRACAEAAVVVESLPGATSIIPALTLSALPTDRFCFEGFLPPKKGRKTRLESLALEERTMVFLESPHKLLKTLGDFAATFGAERPMSVSREITKLHEETYRGTIAEVLAYFEAKGVKGEFVLVVGGHSKNKSKPVQQP
ncbi:MAG: 16S rRNA (cytidine(1402)-2'-O)-methyltransferase [Cryomorphaceae bacterium]|nr:MAG: 16S rRNA (cytidine(1402)-2'-O)-methyltransferase [Cryomorphaceae bacterium]